MAVKCAKCAYLRQPTDSAPETECPKCGAIYAKAVKAPEKPRASRVQTRTVSPMARIKQGLVLAVAAIGVYAMAEKALTPKAQPVPESARSVTNPYEADWQEGFNVGISRALAKNEIEFCGQYKYKRATQRRGEYLVYCSPDSQVWLAYLVWEFSEKVMGPYPPHEKYL